MEKRARNITSMMDYQILSPLHFNIDMSELAETKTTMFMLTNNVALVGQSTFGTSDLGRWEN